MELSITTLLYLFFRLSPFIIVSYFAVSSIFNQDIKGLIYLAGLLISSFIVILLSNLFNSSFSNANMNPNQLCNLITIGGAGSLSKIPLGNSMLCYTFAYLTYVIVYYHIELYNLPTLILFPVLILSDIIWNLKNSCYPIQSILAAIIIGGGVGVGWANTIQSIGKPDLFYLNVGSDQSVCRRPSKQLFKCTYKNTPKKTSDGS